MERERGGGGVNLAKGGVFVGCAGLCLCERVRECECVCVHTYLGTDLLYLSSFVSKSI